MIHFEVFLFYYKNQVKVYCKNREKKNKKYVSFAEMKDIKMMRIYYVKHSINKKVLLMMKIIKIITTREVR